METRRKFQLTLYLLGFAGAGLFTVLLVRQGIGAIGAALATAGWFIILVAIYHVAVPVFLDALAWWVLFPRSERPPLRDLFWMRWIGESISNLLPSAAVGGDIVRARLAAISGGASISTSAASVIVDVTLGIITQIVFTLLGLALLVRATGHTGLVGPTLVGALIGIGAAGGFYLAQRLGLFRFASVLVTKIARSPEWTSLVEGGEALDQRVAALYARRRGAVACCVLTIISLVGSSGEIWIALHALGMHATIMNALILQSMAMTVKSAAFAVPGQLGVQEGGYMTIGSLIGIPTQTAFAISLIARFRDLAVGVPALLTWQLIEGRRLLGRGATRN